MGVYAPHFKRGGPSQKEFFADLGTLLKSFSSGSQVMVVGYFNARLGRAQPGLVGKWSIHNRFRQTKGGDEMVALMQEHGLCAGSTFFQPGKKKGGAATDVPRTKTYGYDGARQLDYVLVSQQYRRSMTNAQACSWMPPVRSTRRRTSLSTKPCAGRSAIHWKKRRRMRSWRTSATAN